MAKQRDIEAAFASLFTRTPNPREAALEALETPESLASALITERETLIERILNPPADPKTGRCLPIGGLSMAQEFTDLMDAVIQRMFALACKRRHVAPHALPIAIVATGGYGRRELCPYSDVDITFIPQRDADPAADRVIKDMFQQLMDVCITRCKVEVGYAYRLINDCGNLDHQTICGLLDARLIAGSQRLFIQFEDAFWTSFNPAEFIFAKQAERAKVLEKWGLSPRIVEPNIKEGAGGLRDIQMAVWLTQAKENLAAARVRGERSLEALEACANVTPADVARLGAAKERLFQTRNALHALTRAERDQFPVTRQEEVAHLLGYHESVIPPNTPPVEVYMADLYADLALVQRVSRQVTRRMENSRLIMGIGVDCLRKRLVPANDALAADDPTWMLWTCELAQRHSLEMSADMEQAICSLADKNPPLGETGPAAQVFTRILSRLGSVYPILQTMADLGVSGWILPEFTGIMNLIPYDPSHDHTVGQHTLYIIQNLEELLGGGGEDEERNNMRRLFRELPHPEELMLAVLLHDTGKAHPGRPHSQVGDEMAREVCKRLQWSEEATANVCFLIRHHLTMAEISRLRDLDLDETIRDFVQIADDPDRLNMLYLLTYADTKAVGAGVWTPVKGRFLYDLWSRASAALHGEDAGEDDGASLVRARRRLLKDLSVTNLPAEEMEEHIQAMPPNYLLSQPLEKIGLHIGFIRRVREGEMVTDFLEERNAGYTELTVCAYDDPNPGLLAKITGVLYAAGLEVHSAHVMTRITERDRIALDTLWVDYRGRPLAPGKQKEVAKHLAEVLTGASDVPAVLKKYAAKAFGKKDVNPDLATQPIRLHAIRNDLSDTLTVIETDSPDTRSALYRVSEALSRLGWDIASAKVSFWQGAARSSFYVAGARHLSEAQARAALAQVLPLQP